MFTIIVILIEIMIFVMYWAIKLWWLWLICVVLCMILHSEADGSGFSTFDYGGKSPRSLEHEMWDWETFYDDP